MALPPIRKVFRDSGPDATHPQYWDHLWADVDVPTALERLRPNPSIVLRELAARVPSGGRVLEAGCGSGVILTYLSELGHEMYGLDFAVTSLGALRRQVPASRVVGGDLARLPFPDGAFNCVISLGTLEHFEGGPAPALREHRRVLADDGTLLILMPRLSWVKRWNDWRGLAGGARTYRSGRNRIVMRVSAPVLGTDADLRFIQYEFPRRAFIAELVAAGFRPVDAFATLNNAGIGESRLVRRIATRRQEQRETSATEPAPGGDATSGGESFSSPALTGRSLPARVKAAIISERGDGPVSAALVRASRTVLGHVDFVVARAVS